MTTKTKVKVLIATVAVLVVMVAVLIAGVCFSLNRTYTFGGKVSFVSSDIKATITKATVRGASIDDSKMQSLEIDGLVNDAENVNSWSGLDFKISKGSKDVVIKFNIVNHSTDRTLKVALGEVTANMVNASISIQFNGQDADDKIAYIGRAKTDQQGNITEESLKQVVITMHINKKNKDASVTDFNLPIVFQNVDGYVININNQGVEDDSNTMIYTDIDANLLKLNDSLEVCGNLITIVNQSEYKFKYSYTKNGGAINYIEVKPNEQFCIGFNSDSSIIISMVKVY